MQSYLNPRSLEAVPNVVAEVRNLRACGRYREANVILNAAVQVITNYTDFGIPLVDDLKSIKSELEQTIFDCAKSNQAKKPLSN